MPAQEACEFYTPEIAVHYGTSTAQHVAVLTRPELRRGSGVKPTVTIFNEDLLESQQMAPVEAKPWDTLQVWWGKETVDGSIVEHPFHLHATFPFYPSADIVKYPWIQALPEATQKQIISSPYSEINTRYITSLRSSTELTLKIKKPAVPPLFILTDGGPWVSSRYHNRRIDLHNPHWQGNPQYQVRINTKHPPYFFEFVIRPPHADEFFVPRLVGRMEFHTDHFTLASLVSSLFKFFEKQRREPTKTTFDEFPLVTSYYFDPEPLVW